MIDVYIRYLRRKIDEGYDEKLIHTVRGAGYVLRAEKMKKISLKVKLTLLYTFFMVLLTCAALAILFSLSSREMLSSVQARLTQRVQGEYREY